MAQNNFDATGVLVLDQVTPVIRALFRAFNLDENYPGNGEVYIAKLSEDCDPSWGTWSEHVFDFANELAVSVTDTGNAVEDCLNALAAHFGTNVGDILEGQDLDEENNADLGTILAIARRFDDGHGLKAMTMEGAWYCSKPRLGAFGGFGEYCGRHFDLHITSTEYRLGMGVEDALEQSNPALAAERVAKHVERILAGIHDEATRVAVRKSLGETLVASAVN